MFQTILQALVPVVFVVGLGWLVGRLGVIDPEHIRSITTFIVTVALPAALFCRRIQLLTNPTRERPLPFDLGVAPMGAWALALPAWHSAVRRHPQACLH
jgi:predicted permease